MRRQIRPTLCTLLCALHMAAAGCSGEQASENAFSAPPRASSFGIVNLQHVEHVADASGTSKQTLTATAYFARHHAISTKRLSELLALPLDPSADLPALDTCQVYDTGAALTEDEVRGETGAYVDLLESGSIELATRGARLTLEPSYFPGLIPYISGAVYGEAQVDSVSLPPSVAAGSKGSEAVGAFRADVTSPTPWVMTVQADQPLKKGLSLSWKPAVGLVQADVAYVSIRQGDSSPNQELRCRLSDDGSFRLSPHHIEALVQTTGSASARYVLEAGRIRIHSFKAQRLEQAELRIGSSQRASLRLR